MRVRMGLLIGLLALILAGCGTTKQVNEPQAGKLNVVTTVAPITNIVYNIGGDRIALNGIVPEGVNSHTFEPAPSDAALLARADLIVMNGLNLEEPTRKLAEANRQESAQIVMLGDQTITPAEYVGAIGHRTP